MISRVRGWVQRLQQHVRQKKKKRPLFYWLLLSFLSIISLLVLFILYSLGFFRGQIRDEIIRYNTLNLQNTVAGYENHLQLVQNAMFTFSLNHKIALLKHDPIPYETAKKFMSDIRRLSNNPSLHLENIIVYFQNNAYVLEKGRGGDDIVIFDRYLYSDEYSPEFWRSQFGEAYQMKMLPATRFTETGPQQSGSGAGKAVIPVAFKHYTDPTVLLVALMDAQKLYDGFHVSINEHFYIMDDRQVIYQGSSPPGIEQLPDIQGTHGFVRKDRYYYFYQQGSSSGLIYVNVVHDNNIAPQMTWNVTFVSLLVLSVMISVFASLYFSMLLKRPVKQIVDSIRQLNMSRPQTSIEEYAIIHDQVGHMIRTQQSYGRDLQTKNSLLRYYSYMNKLRNIRDPLHELKDVVAVNQPYHLILFHSHFKQDPSREFALEVDRATSFLREFIDRALLKTHDGSLTFQVEEDRIVSIVFAGGPMSELQAALKEMKLVFDLDRPYCYLSVAVSSRYDSADEFHTAYKQAVELAESRAFQDETQVIYADRPNIFYDKSFLFSPAQDQEFDIHMSNGNVEHVLHLMRRMLLLMERKKATARQTREFCHAIVSRTVRLLQDSKLDTQPAVELHERVRQCHTFQQLNAVLAAALPRIGERLRERAVHKEPPISEFVKSYLQDHYHEEITLDMIAEKLHLTPAYLSTYFKEKTGINFVDYVNKVRIDKAKELLSQPSVKIQEAAARAGYHSLSSFNRTFRKFTGVTPSEYRRTLHGHQSKNMP